MGANGFTHTGFKQLFLIVEVEIDGAFADANLSCDILKPGAGKAIPGKDFERRLNNFQGASLLLGSPTPFLFCRCERHS